MDTSIIDHLNGFLLGLSLVNSFTNHGCHFEFREISGGNELTNCIATSYRGPVDPELIALELIDDWHRYVKDRISYWCLFRESLQADLTRETVERSEYYDRHDMQGIREQCSQQVLRCLRSLCYPMEPDVWKVEGVSLGNLEDIMLFAWGSRLFLMELYVTD